MAAGDAGPADGSASPRERAIVLFYAGWRDAWTTHRPGHRPTLLDAAAEFEVEGDLLGVAMATTTAGVAEINSSAPDVAAAPGWLRAGAEAFRAAARRVGRMPRARRTRTDRAAGRPIR